LTLDHAGKQALVQYIAQSRLDGEIGLQISAFEAYYPAKGHYGAFHTCNQWIANGLAAAGLPHAWFSPFGFGVTWPLKADQKA
jgi:Protein of unknown function (DUF2459)